jgi:hypothetical protein
MDLDQARELFRSLVNESEKLEDTSQDPILITFIAHPHPTGDDGAGSK